MADDTFPAGRPVEIDGEEHHLSRAKDGRIMLVHALTGVTFGARGVNGAAGPLTDGEFEQLVSSGRARIKPAASKTTNGLPVVTVFADSASKAIVGWALTPAEPRSAGG